jgi:hypothetical protein
MNTSRFPSLTAAVNYFLRRPHEMRVNDARRGTGTFAAVMVVAALGCNTAAAASSAPSQQQVTTSTDLDETRTVAVVATPLQSEERSPTHLAPTGIGSLYWAARHAAQARRVLLPIPPGDRSGAFADVKTTCVVFPDPPNGEAPC